MILYTRWYKHLCIGRRKSSYRCLKSLTISTQGCHCFSHKFQYQCITSHTFSDFLIKHLSLYISHSLNHLFSAYEVYDKAPLRDSAIFNHEVQVNISYWWINAVTTFNCKHPPLPFILKGQSLEYPLLDILSSWAHFFALMCSWEGRSHFDMWNLY